MWCLIVNVVVGKRNSSVAFLPALGLHKWIHLTENRDLLPEKDKLLDCAKVVGGFWLDYSFVHICQNVREAWLFEGFPDDHKRP